jgi:RNA polymerase sigma-70 factor (ECF subfamily)
MLAEDPSSKQHRPEGAAFRTTHWSVVLAAGNSFGPECQRALEKLCRTYWYPLYVYVRRRGYSAHDAQDLTQEFFAGVLRSDYLKRADPQRGKFRSFLLAGLQNFLANEWDRAQAVKRGGGHVFISLDEQSPEERYRHEPVTDASPQKLFERRWAMALLEQALEQLRLECVAAGKAPQFDSLKPFLSGETVDGDYAASAAKLGVKAESVAVAVHRLRQRYRQLVETEIAHTVATPAEAREEMRYLFATLTG